MKNRTQSPEPAADRPKGMIAGEPRGGASGQRGGAGGAFLFTAFEPSGDALAAGVIRELRRRAPAVRIWAWGGPRMQEAGAELVANTAGGAAMGLAAVGRALAVRREVRSIARWLTQHHVNVLVPVDSPAANFPICRIARRQGLRIVHLAAPQLWAWGRWRLGKLRRRTDLVLCLLPFEEEWFRSRRIPAAFIGHPTVNRTVDARALREQMHGLPQGAPRIAIFPGSRAHEVKANIRLLVDVFTELQARHAGAGGVIVAASPELARLIRRRIAVVSTGLHMVTGGADAAIAWCDLALAVSGTITLDIALQRKPMIGVYRTGWFMWLLAKLILRTPFVLLPNIIAAREIVPEFAPHAGGSAGIIRAATRYLQDSKRGAVQAEELNRVCLRFATKRPAEEAAGHLLRMVGATP